MELPRGGMRRATLHGPGAAPAPGPLGVGHQQIPALQSAWAPSYLTTHLVLQAGSRKEPPCPPCALAWGLRSWCWAHSYQQIPCPGLGAEDIQSMDICARQV